MDGCTPATCARWTTAATARVEGRLKDMIIRGGENIYPRELEDLLFAHPTVGEVAVVGLPDDRMGEVVAAFIRPAPGQTVSKDELFAYMREHLAPHKTPKHWVSAGRVPGQTASGKIQKYKLPRPVGRRRVRGAVTRTRDAEAMVT